MLKTFAHLVTAAFARRAARIRENPETASGSLDRFVKAALYHRALATSDLKHLAWYHRNYWTSERSRSYYEDRRQFAAQLRSQFSFIEHITAHVASYANDVKHVVEIGSGDGRFLAELGRTLQSVETFSGIDLNAEQNDRNRKRYGSALSFHTSDANRWIMQYAQPRTLFVTAGGVFEYFAQSELEQLLHFAHSALAPCAFALLEPLAPDHDLATEHDSRIYGSERSFSHNYAALLRAQSFSILDQQEQTFGDYHWIRLLAGQ